MPLGLGWLKTQGGLALLTCSMTHCDEQTHVGEMGDNEKRSGPCDVERAGTEDVKVVRKRLILASFAAAWSQGDVLG